MSSISLHYIPEPFLFNPLKHHLTYIRQFIAGLEQPDIEAEALKALRQTGSSVMDVYRGELGIDEIVLQIGNNLRILNAFSMQDFAGWAGTQKTEFRLMTLSDNSSWTLKYNPGLRYVHFFPARTGPHTFRIKANTLKSAILYLAFAGKDYVSEENLNRARALAGLSPVKDVSDSEAITEMIEIIRNDPGSGS